MIAFTETFNGLMIFTSIDPELTPARKCCFLAGKIRPESKARSRC
jgi:hypothetical protein